MSIRRAVSMTVAALALLAPVAALGHHILGIPHYAYDEQYPQVPVLTYRVNAGSYEVKLTGYPGKPEPGDFCSVHVYIQHLETGEPFDGAVSLTVLRDRLVGPDPVIYGPMTSTLEDAVYKFFPKFEDEANYTIRVEYEADGAPWILDLPMVIGEPGSPLALLAGVAAGVILFLVVIRALRIKRRRRLSAGVATA